MVKNKISVAKLKNPTEENESIEVKIITLTLCIEVFKTLLKKRGNPKDKYFHLEILKFLMFTLGKLFFTKNMLIIKTIVLPSNNPTIAPSNP